MGSFIAWDGGYARPRTRSTQLTLSITPIPILSDNYAWLVIEPQSHKLAIVDPAEEAPVMAAIEAAQQQGAVPALILLTHHHMDHIAAAEAIRVRTGAKIVGASADRHRLPSLDQAVGEADQVELGAVRANVMETPGHTIGHIAYYFADGTRAALFCGDTLFSLGCGRLLEGTAADMHASLQRLGRLPDHSLVCCGHEYTESNARFALAALPQNLELAAQARVVTEKRRRAEPTVPTSLGLEKATNPFLLASDLEEFTRLRSWKDGFR